MLIQEWRIGQRTSGVSLTDVLMRLFERKTQGYSFQGGLWLVLLHLKSGLRKCALLWWGQGLILYLKRWQRAVEFISSPRRERTGALIGDTIVFGFVGICSYIHEKCPALWVRFELLIDVIGSHQCAPVDDETYQSITDPIWVPLRERASIENSWVTAASDWVQ
jgi:hypothetical protein